MKIPLKYMSVLVVVSLTAIFLYQTYWLVNLYNTMYSSMKRSINEAIRMSDYEEMMHRVKALRADNNRQHGTIEFSAGSSVDSSMVLGTTYITGQKPKEYMKIVKKMSEKGSKVIVIDDENEHATVNSPDSQVSALNVNQDFSTMLKDRNNMEELLNYLQRGLHSGLDVMSDPDAKYLDSLLTKHLNDLGITAAHRLLYLESGSTTDSSYTYTDTVAVIGTGIKGKMETYRYATDLNSHRTYLLQLPPIQRVVLRQMAGILATSLFIMLILGFSFYYLMRTILRQRTLDEMKTDFTNNMTHELKTPISVAYAANDALLNFGAAADPRRMQEYLKVCKEQLERLTNLVEQILSMSMERRRTMKLDMTDVPVKPIVDAVVRQQQLKADCETEITVVVEPPDMTVRADRQHLFHVISNLVDNAVKYSHGKATVEIRCTESTISVADHGIGIPQDKLKYVFDRFYRVPDGNLHNVKGYGLGLYYVKSMMDKFGGYVDVESKVGQGTVFNLHFNG